MDTTRIGQTALVGWREKVAERVVEPAASRAGVDADRARAAVGIVFFLLSASYVVMTIVRAARAARA